MSQKKLDGRYWRAADKGIAINKDHQATMLTHETYLYLAAVALAVSRPQCPCNKLVPEGHTLAVAFFKVECARTVTLMYTIWYHNATSSMSAKPASGHHETCNKPEFRADCRHTASLRAYLPKSMARLQTRSFKHFCRILDVLRIHL